MLEGLRQVLAAVAFVALGTPVTWLELAGFVSGALCVWLTARQNVWNWPIGIANSAAFLLLFVMSGLFADSALQVVYIVLGVYGWWAWLRGGEGHEELLVSRTTSRQWWTLAALGLAGTAVLTYGLHRATSSTVPFWDAVTTVLSLLATWGQCRKKVESWWIWIAADAIYVPLYAIKGLWLTALLFAGFIVLCVGGLRAWRRDLAGEPALRLAPFET
jgi:nicotinamide mononucleotide transporter